MKTLQLVLAAFAAIGSLVHALPQDPRPGEPVERPTPRDPRASTPPGTPSSPVPPGPPPPPGAPPVPPAGGPPGAPPVGGPDDPLTALIMTAAQNPEIQGGLAKFMENLAKQMEKGEDLDLNKAKKEANLKDRDLETLVAGVSGIMPKDPKGKGDKDKDKDEKKDDKDDKKDEKEDKDKDEKKDKDDKKGDKKDDKEDKDAQDKKKDDKKKDDPDGAGTISLSLGAVLAVVSVWFLL